jgi:UDP-glucose:(heptosyl)LPS alpha-1,3-glucosyltransferase
MPFNQEKFNQQFLEMRQSAQKQQSSVNGLQYAKEIMQANDGSAEAAILIELALQKRLALQKEPALQETNVHD